MYLSLLLTSILLLINPSLHAMGPDAASEQEQKLKHAQQTVAITEELLPAVVSFRAVEEERIGHVYESGSDDDEEIADSRNLCDKYLRQVDKFFGRTHELASQLSKPQPPTILAGIKLTPFSKRGEDKKNEYTNTIRSQFGVPEMAVNPITPETVIIRMGGVIRPQQLAILSFSDGHKQYCINDYDQEIIQKLTEEQRTFIKNLYYKTPKPSKLKRHAADSEDEQEEKPAKLLLDDTEWKILSSLPESMQQLLIQNLGLGSQTEVTEKLKNEAEELLKINEQYAQKCTQLTQDYESHKEKLESMYKEYQEKMAAVPQELIGPVVEQQWTTHLSQEEQRDSAVQQAISTRIDALAQQSKDAINSIQARLSILEAAPAPVVTARIERADRFNRTTVARAVICVSAIAGGIWLLKYWWNKRIA